MEIAIQISRGLIKRGHQVDLYAPLGSQLKTPVKSLNLKPLVSSYKNFQSLLKSVDLLTHYAPGLWDSYYVGIMFQQAAAGKYDLLHFHHPETAMPFAGLFPNVPVVYTLHDPIKMLHRPIFSWYRELFKMYTSPNQFYVSISDSQRRPAPKLPYAATVHNGIDLKKWRFSAKPDNYLLYVGRIVPEKGLKEAIKVARLTNHKLLIIGPTFDDQKDYFYKYVEPELDNQIQYIGFVKHNKMGPYFQKAKAFLMPIQWEEPFGLTMIEAMACGTPVIGFRRGSVPEIVIDGKTGYVVDTVKEMAKAVTKIEKIDRRACRYHVEHNFTIDNMTEGYEAAYQTILKGFPQ